LDSRLGGCVSADLAGSRADRRPHPVGDETMNLYVLELGLLVLTAISFWLLDRYVIGCEKI
jgi:hypothetical protein